MRDRLIDYEDEQIKEIARIMNEVCNVYDEQGNHIRNKCYECEEWSDDNHCCCSYNRKEAKALYDAGYRKQKEGEWIDFPSYGSSGWQRNGKQVFPKYCSACGDIYSYAYKYCPHCGAKMKGGAEE